MSLIAICPVNLLLAANADLESQGFGPNNFSVPAYVGSGAQYGAFHAWDNAAFAAAVKALGGVAWQEGPLQTGVDGDGNPVVTDDPVARTKALIEAQGAKWGDQAPELPSTGTVTAGSLYRYEDSLWSVIQSFNRSVYGQPPATYPALIRRVRNPKAVEAWVQPLDQYDAYKLVSPFTGEADRCTHNGSEWYVTQADGSGNNVWQPGVFGWTKA